MIVATDARVANNLANHSTIFALSVPAGFEATLDYSACFDPEYADRFRFFHDEAETIGIFLEKTATMDDGGVWEFHVGALPQTRGLEALRFATAVLHEMFFNQGAAAVWAEPAITNIRARYFARKVGGISQGRAFSPLLGEVELFLTRRSEWRGFRDKYQTMNNQVTSCPR
ncbi:MULTISPECIES: hypothetical protein [Sphingomonas]|uniref:hypothetical protein n=1 Tax=Sphingomonas TaxID=13687 RepID=UPI00126996AF|nr:MULTISPECIES: hypothetical protein [Sphingomonas]